MDCIVDWMHSVQAHCHMDIAVEMDTVVRSGWNDNQTSLITEDYPIGAALALAFIVEAQHHHPYGFVPEDTPEPMATMMRTEWAKLSTRNMRTFQMGTQFARRALRDQKQMDRLKELNVKPHELLLYPGLQLRWEENLKYQILVDGFCREHDRDVAIVLRSLVTKFIVTSKALVLKVQCLGPLSRSDVFLIVLIPFMFPQSELSPLRSVLSSCFFPVLSSCFFILNCLLSVVFSESDQAVPTMPDLKSGSAPQNPNCTVQRLISRH